MEIITLETPELGDRSYLVHDGAVGAVIDPQRDLDRILAEIERAGARVAFVLETHIHNDYVTGGLELARRTGAEYVVSAADDVSFRRRPISDGELIQVGSLALRAVHTPGHTHNHLSYVVTDSADAQAVFTGGSLLFGTVGRTDLLGPADTDELTRRQHRSAWRLAELAETTSVHPTHGFGSFCASGASSGASSSTIGAERLGNLALTTGDADRFARTLLANLEPYPAYYAHVGPLNRRGGGGWGVEPPRALAVDELRRRIDGGDWVLDLRDRGKFADAHVPGSLGFEHATQFSTYVGWLLPWGAEITLIGADHAQVRAAQRDLARIGMDRLAGASTENPERLSGARGPSSYSITDFRGLAAHGLEGITVLDVRQRSEWEAGHLPGATHLPIQQVPDSLAGVPAGQVWVHCGSGYRSSIAASFLDRSGRDVVLIDDYWHNAEKAGLEITG